MTIAAAEAADNPGSPGEAVGRMRVFEPFTLDLEILVEGGEGCDVVGIEGKPDGLMVTAIARLQELDSDACGLGGDRDQLEEPLGGRDLAVFEIEALRLEDAAELRDQPATLVPFHDAPGLFCIRHRMSSEKPPVQRLCTGLRISLTHIDHGQRQTFWHTAQELGLRPSQSHQAEAQGEHCGTLKRARQAPLAASTASIGSSCGRRVLLLAVSQSSRRRSAVVAKLISLVSWIARKWRPSAAVAVPSLQLSIKRVVVTLSLPRKRLNRTSRARPPLASRRRQTSSPATMHSMSAAPLYRDDDPRTDPMTSQSAPAYRHLC